MATYNGAQYIYEQLVSLAWQTYAPYELVISDDGSTDSTVAIIMSFASDAPFSVRLHRNHARLGYGDNFFVAAGLSKGDWIAFCDQDDVWLPHKLERIRQVIEENPHINVVVHDAVLSDAEMRPIGGKVNARLYRIIRNRGVPALGFPFRTYSGFCCVIKRRLFEVIPKEERPWFPDGHAIPHDLWATILAYIFGGTYFLSDPLVLYRRHDEAETANFNYGLVAKLGRITETTPNLYKREAGLYRNIAACARNAAAHCQDIKDREPLSSGARQFNSMASWAEGRMRLYEEARLWRRGLLFTRGLKSGCYFGFRGARSFGMLALAKDLIRVWTSGVKDSGLKANEQSERYNDNELQTQGEIAGLADSESACSASIRTVFICFYTAYPVTGGVSSVTYQLARHWPGDRTLVQLGTDAGDVTLEEGFRLVTLPFRGDGRLRKLLQVPGWIRLMVRTAREIGPDVLVLEGASWVAYHWGLLEFLRRAVPRTPVVYHSHNVEYDLRHQKHGFAVSAITRQLERRVLARSSVATAVSDRDQARFRQLYGVEPALLPNGIDGNWLKSARVEDCEAVRSKYGLGRGVVLFMGSYAYRPNREAIDFLVQKVFPRVVECQPQAQLVIVGGDVPYRRPWLTNPGLLPAAQLPAVIRASAVSVAPIFSGSGTRLKIIESLVAGTPVVTTRKGMEGLSLKPGSDVLVAGSPEEFAEQIALCLRAPEATRERFRCVAEKVCEHYEWQQIIRRFTEDQPQHLQGLCGRADTAARAQARGQV